MNRKNFLTNDVHTISYGNSKCVVRCPKCNETRSVSTSDYYTKRKNGEVLCRECNKPTNRKRSTTNDPQIVHRPESFARNQKLTLSAICSQCQQIKSININNFWKIKERNGTWTCYKCRKPSITKKSKNNEKYKNPEYCNRFRELHNDEEYKSKVHNENINNKISKSIKARWNDPTKRESLVAKRNTKEFKEAASQKSKEWWAEHQTAVQQTNANNFANKASKLHNYQFRHNGYISITQSINIECTICGHQFRQIALSHYRSCKCPKCGQSRGQQEIMEFIAKHAEYNINDRIAISPKEIDIYVPKHKFGLEYHGLYWHSFNSPETPTQKRKHQDKAKLAIASGISLMQIFEHEWINKRPIIESMILHKLGKSRKLNARSLEIIEIDNKTAQPFYDRTHLLGFRTARWTYALTDGVGLMTVMSCSNHKDNNTIELMRVSSELGYTIRGGVSKLLKHIIRHLKPDKVITYADMRYSDGGGYSSSGFKLVNITRPNYFYYKGDEILSRQRCQKHKLPRLLNNFDPSISEAENMFGNGFRRVWDAGHMKFEL